MPQEMTDMGIIHASGMMSQHEPTSDRTQKMNATRRRLRSVSVMGYSAAGAAGATGWAYTCW